MCSSQGTLHPYNESYRSVHHQVVNWISLHRKRGIKAGRHVKRKICVLTGVTDIFYTCRQKCINPQNLICLNIGNNGIAHSDILQAIQTRVHPRLPVSGTRPERRTANKSNLGPIPKDQKDVLSDKSARCISFYTLNCRSIKDKTTSITCNSVDLICLKETWLRPDNRLIIGE